MRRYSRYSDDLYENMDIDLMEDADIEQVLEPKRDPEIIKAAAEDIAEALVDFVGSVNETLDSYRLDDLDSIDVGVALSELFKLVEATNGDPHWQGGTPMGSFRRLSKLGKISTFKKRPLCLFVDEKDSPYQNKQGKAITLFVGRAAREVAMNLGYIHNSDGRKLYARAKVLYVKDNPDQFPNGIFTKGAKYPRDEIQRYYSQVSL